MEKRASGEGHIHYRAWDGRWEKRITLPNGKPKSVYGKTRTEALAEARKLQRLIEDNLPLPDNEMTVSKHFEEWLEVVVRPNRSVQTYRNYRMHVDLYIDPLIGKTKLHDLNTKACQVVVNARSHAGAAPASIRYTKAVLVRGLNIAIAWDRVQRNVAHFVECPPVPEQETLVLNLDEIGTCLDAIKGHWLEVAYALAVGLGLRQGECLGLRWSDIDFDQGLLTIRHQMQSLRGRTEASLTGNHRIVKIIGTRALVSLKTAKSKATMVMPDFLVEALKRTRTRQRRQRLKAGVDWKDHDLVLATPRGEPIDAANTNRRLKEILEAARLPSVHFHGLRHSYASAQHELGRGELSLRDLRDIVRHTDIRQTMRYVHQVTDISQKAAANMNKRLNDKAG